jgi:hypothetical protein
MTEGSKPVLPRRVVTNNRQLSNCWEGARVTKEQNLKLYFHLLTVATVCTAELPTAVR